MFLNATSFPLLENSSLSLDSTEFFLGADFKLPEKKKIYEVKINSTNYTNSCNSEWNKKKLKSIKIIKNALKYLN